MAKVFYETFNYIIAEINTKNTRSINAHMIIGFYELTRYNFENETWIIVFKKI